MMNSRFVVSLLYVNIAGISDFILHRNLKVDHGKLLLLKRLMIHSCGRMIGKMMT